MTGSLTQGRQVLERFIASNSIGVPPKRGTTARMLDELRRALGDSLIPSMAFRYIQFLDAEGDGKDAVGYAKVLLRTLAPSQQSAKAKRVIKAAKRVIKAANGVNQVKATQTSLKLQMLANDIGKIAADWERFEREEHRKPNWTAYARFRNRWLGAWYDIEVADRDFVTERIPNRAGLDDLINAINEDLPSPAKHLRKVERAFRVAARQTAKT